MMERKDLGKNIIVAVIVIFSLLSYSCKKNNSIEEEPVGGPVRVYVEDTFTNSSLNDIPVTLECNGNVMEGKTSGGIVTFDLDNVYTCNIKINFSNSQASRNNDYVASVVERMGLTGGEDINIDIVRKDDINPSGYNWKELLNVYRGRDNSGIGYPNQVWVKQPEKWVVYDPHGYLKQYSDEKNNAIFNNIMKGFKAIQEYTNGFIKAPSRSEVEIRYETKHWVENGVFFEITDGRAYEADDENSNDEIIRSGAGGGPSPDPNNYMSELVSSVQGGDNEGMVDSVTSGAGYVTEIDKIWGNFNYYKRKPGDKFFLDGEYGHLYEVRKLK